MAYRDPGVFHRPVLDNLRVSKTGTDHAEIKVAVVAAETAAFIARKPERYEMMVAQRGRSLSGGERQHPPIARAISHTACPPCAMPT